LGTLFLTMHNRQIWKMRAYLRRKNKDAKKENS
jgi:hypothetical protein